jgi:hypothetical protein
LALPLTGPDASAATAAALLVYLYCDCLDFKCPPHKLPHLARLADGLFLPRLATLARAAGRASWGRGGDAAVAAGEDDAVPSSTFEADLERVVGHRQSADVRFFVAPGSDELWAHRVLLDRVPFFRALLSGPFKRDAGPAAPHNTADYSAARGSSVAHGTGGVSGGPLYGSRDGGVLHVDVTGLALDGVKLATLKALLRFVYGGSTAALPTHPDALTGK